MKWWYIVIAGLFLFSHTPYIGQAQELDSHADLTFETHFEGVGTSIAWHPSGDYFVAGIDSILYLFTPSDDTPFQTIELPNVIENPRWSEIQGLEWNPSGTQLAILWNDIDKKPYTIWIMDAITQEISEIDIESMVSIHWSPNGQFLAGVQGAWDNNEGDIGVSSFIVLDRKTRNISSQYRSVEYEPIHANDIDDNPVGLAWVSDSQLITASIRAKLAIIDINANIIEMIEEQPDQQRDQLGVIGSSYNDYRNMQVLAWSDSNNFLAFNSAFYTTPNEAAINIWSLEDGRLVTQLIGHEWFITAVEWRPNANILASGSLDKTLRIWDIDLNQEIEILYHDDLVNSIAWSPKGNQLASITENGTVYLWKVFIPSNCSGG